MCIILLGPQKDESFKERHVWHGRAPDPVAVAQKTGIPQWVARSVSGNMETKTYKTWKHGDQHKEKMETPTRAVCLFLPSDPFGFEPHPSLSAAEGRAVW